jgi:hypothetical protein
VRFTRLVIEGDRSTVSLALHPCLTVVAGVDERVRSGLTDELLGGLTGTRAGVHLELTDDTGRHLAVSRTSGGAHRVVDLSHGEDVSREFRSADSTLDLLAHHGLDRCVARQLLQVDRSRLEADSHRDEVVSRLAALDQSELWSAASRVCLTDGELRALHEELDEAGLDPELVAKIEQRHQSLEAVLDQHRRLRRRAAQVSTVSLGAALLVAMVSPVNALLIVAIGALTLVLTFVYRARVEAVQRAEAAALADAGTDSYLGFMVKRVDGLFDGTAHRQRLMAVGEDHRAAAVAWTRLAGDVSVGWAMSHHDDIEAKARLRAHLRSMGHVSSTAPDLDDETAGIACALIAHPTRLCGLGAGGESFPLILDNPFTELSSSTRILLLDLLGRIAGRPQVILLTNHEEVADWARLEAPTGTVTLVEPESEPVDGEVAHRSHHLAV